MVGSNEGWNGENGIRWSMDLNEDSENDTKSLMGLMKEPPKYNVTVASIIYVKGKQYARPFTYTKYTDLGKAAMNFAESNPFALDELYKFSVKLQGFGSPSD